MFLQPDPTVYGDGMNMYVYAHNNPVNFYDPTGLWTAGFNVSVTVGFGTYYTMGASVVWDGHGNLAIMSNVGVHSIRKTVRVWTAGTATEYTYPFLALYHYRHTNETPWHPRRITGTTVVNTAAGHAARNYNGDGYDCEL